MLPDHVDPFVLGVLSLLCVVSTLVGVFMLRKVWMVWNEAVPARFRIADFAINTSGEGVFYKPLYEVLTGPRAGEIVSSSGVDSHVATYTVSTTDRDDKQIKKVRAQIGEECEGRVHPSLPVGVTKRNFMVELFGAGFILLFGFLSAGLIAHLLLR